MTTIDKARLKQLAALDARPASVISMYLNLDRTNFSTARARKQEIESLLARARRLAHEDHGSDESGRRAAERDVERIRKYFEDEFDAKGARGLALFVAGDADLFEVHKLPEPIPTDVVMAHKPYVEPLTVYASKNGYRLAVLLISRRFARVLVGEPQELRETVRFTDDVHGRHDKGGWAQARFQRGIEKEVDDHLKHTASVLREECNRVGADRVIIGSTEELYPRVLASLHPYVRDRVSARIDVEVETVSKLELEAEVVAALDADLEKTRKYWLDKLVAEVGRGAKGVKGLDATLRALNDASVEALLVSEKYRAPGKSCPRCRFLTVDGATCDRDGAQLESYDDIVELAVEAAIGQSAKTVFFTESRELDSLGSIGAALRFQEPVQK